MRALPVNVGSAEATSQARKASEYRRLRRARFEGQDPKSTSRRFVDDNSVVRHAVILEQRLSGGLPWGAAHRPLRSCSLSRFPAICYSQFVILVHSLVVEPLLDGKDGVS